MRMCPFKTESCGGSGGGIGPDLALTHEGQQYDIDLNVRAGDTCTFTVQTSCGLPTFVFSNPVGFDIEIIDYDDKDLKITATGIPFSDTKLYSYPTYIDALPAPVEVIYNSIQTDFTFPDVNISSIISNY